MMTESISMPGLDAMVGYQLQDNLSLRARLDWGLTQDSADPSFDKVWTRNFSITCAYTLGQHNCDRSSAKGTAALAAAVFPGCGLKGKG
jgi:hypothetical protein